MIVLTMRDALQRMLGKSHHLASEDSTHLNDDVWVYVDVDGDVFEYKVTDMELTRDSKRTYLCLNCPEK